jgi:hypothetical protein
VTALRLLLTGLGLLLLALTAVSALEHGRRTPEPEPTVDHYA